MDFPALVTSPLLCALLLLWVALHQWRVRRPPRPRLAPVKVLAVFGSGGHTSEMLALLAALPIARYSPRTYARAATDVTSEGRAIALGAVPPDAAPFAILPRAREVGQPLLSVTSVWGTLRGALAATLLIAREQPGLVLTNGPGTCLPVCIAAVALRGVGLLPLDSRIIFVESICRVTSLSLSGRLVYACGLADTFAVQHKDLLATYPRAHYVGPVL